MKPIFLALLGAASLHAAPVAIFDGKSTDGWRIQDGKGWSVADGILTGENKAGDDTFKKGSTLWTTEEYKNFTVELEFRFTNGNLTDQRVDSGVFLRNSSDQIQIGVSGSKKRDLTGSPYIGAKKGYPVEADGVAALLKENDWNKMKITAKGPVYTVELNGKKIVEYTSESASEKGPVGLQVHGGTAMKVEFRNMTLEEIE